MVGRRIGKGGRHAPQKRAIPRRENAVAGALRISDTLGRRKIIAVVEPQLKPGLQCFFALPPPGLVAAGRVNPCAPGFRRDAFKHFSGRAAAQDEPAAAFAEARIERGEAVMEPPELRAAASACSGAPVTPSVERETQTRA